MSAIAMNFGVAVFSPLCTQVRSMATLKDISLRLKSVKNIQKITKSMKMVSAAKYAKAERELKPARPYGKGAAAFYEKADVKSDEKKPNHLIVAITSDRGLCGAVHSNIARAIKASLAEKPSGVSTKIVCVGDKSRSLLQRLYGSMFLLSFSDLGRKPPTFSDASVITQCILSSGYEYDHAEIYFNTFKSVVSYATTKNPIYSLEAIQSAEKINIYDSLDGEVLRCYQEYSLASLIYHALKENACSEQSSRMTAMDSASKNAGEMIDKLTLTFNRTRQAVITRELIEIISGAAAL